MNIEGTVEVGTKVITKESISSYDPETFEFNEMIPIGTEGIVSDMVYKMKLDMTGIAVEFPSIKNPDTQKPVKVVYLCPNRNNILRPFNEVFDLV